MQNIDYKQRRRNRKKTFYRISLGIKQIIYKPYLVIILIPIIVGTVYIWAEKNYILELVQIPSFLEAIYNYCYITLGILMPLVLLLGIFTTIGELTAREDEADLQEAFTEQEQRNGYPILIDKRRVKHTKATMREFYTEIPMRTWLERQEEIADLMNVRFVEKLKHGDGYGRRIKMITVSSRASKTSGDLYDDEF